MTEQKPPIWTPPEKIDENVRRMAWLLFLELWKKHEGVMQNIDAQYLYALGAAKIVRRIEENPNEDDLESENQA